MPEFLRLKGDGRDARAAVEHWEMLAREAAGFFLDVAEDTAAFVLLAVKQAAAGASPEWAAAADQAYVARTERGVGLAFPFEAYDLEYGNPEEGIDKDPVIRRTITQEGKKNRQRFNNLAHERMGL